MSRKTRPTPVIAAAVLGFMMLALHSGCASKPQPVREREFAFWPPAPNEPRVQFLVAYNSSRDITPARSSMQDLIYGREQEQSLALAKPYGVAMWNGRIYVCDVRGGGGVIVLDLRNQQTRVMGATGTGAVQKAVDVAVAPDGIKYVADQGRNSVAVFDANERFIQSFIDADWSPVGVAVYENELFVSDFKGQQVKVLDRRTGQTLRVIGSPGGTDGHFIRPLSITVDKSGNVIVSDVIRARIQKFDREGNLLLAFGEAGNRPGTFVRPKHLDVSSDGVLYVVDAAFNNVQLFDEKGQAMMFFGSPGAHAGAMDLPAGLAVHEADVELFEQYVHPAFKAERIVVVTNQFGPQKIAVYAQGQLREGYTIQDIANSRADVTAVAAMPGSSEMVDAAHGAAHGATTSGTESPAPAADAAQQQ